MIMITLEWIYYSFVLAINTDVDFDWRHILMFKSKSMQVEENYSSDYSELYPLKSKYQSMHGHSCW